MRVSDSSEAIRTDPEPVVFSDSAFVYYTQVITDDNSASLTYSVRKCDTGLANLYTEAENKQKSMECHFSVFPNPGTGKFTLNKPSFFDKVAMVTVYDLSGRLVLSKVLENGSRDLNVEELSNGRYLLQLQNQNHTAYTDFTIVK